jgi:fibronectin type 3 domain-containing protein
MRKAGILILSIVLLYSFQLKAQIKQPEYKIKKPSVFVMARSKGDSVLLRWAPDDPLLWKIANQYGYRVIRIKVAENDRLLFGTQRVTIIVADSVRPYPLEKIEPLIEIDQYAAVVGQAIYGEDFEVSASFDKNPADLLNKARELEDRFSFALFSADQSALAARVHGLAFTDKHVDIDDKYLYSVYPLIPEGIIEFDTAFTVLGVKDTASLPKPYDLKATFSDKYVELSWNREYLQKFYTSYIVERSDDDGHSYNKTSNTPFLNITENPDKQANNFYRVDSLPQNNKTYFFRIRGISPFGETGPPSEAVSGVGVDKTEFINPVITNHNIINNTAVKIEWEILEDLASDVYGFEVERAQKSDGNYTLLHAGTLDKNVRSFIDPMALKSGFYRVASIDKSGGRHYSFPAMVLLPDSVPPGTPVNFKGEVDSSGIVTLTWDANTEEDLAGYRVYRSNYADDGFLKMNNEQIKDLKFQDTLSLRVLTKNVYYKLAAIDNHFNESQLTSPLVITRPDTILPAPPSFRNYAVTDSGIIIYWAKSPSEDIKDHLLFRRKSGEEQWQRINPVNDTSTQYTDTDIINQVVYQYVIIAVDQSGLESEPLNVIDIRASGTPGQLSLQIEVRAIAAINGKSIAVSWSANHASGIVKYALFRAVDDEAIFMYSTLESNQKSFSDENVKIGHVYHYRIQAITSYGVRSMLSPEAVVNF